MSDNVTKLNTETDANKKAALEVLEKFIDLVKEGKVVAVAIAAVRADRTSATHGWSSCDCVPALLGAASGMHVIMAIDSFTNARRDGR